MEYYVFRAQAIAIYCNRLQVGTKHNEKGPLYATILSYITIVDSSCPNHSCITAESAIVERGLKTKNSIQVTEFTIASTVMVQFYLTHGDSHG